MRLEADFREFYEREYPTVLGATFLLARDRSAAEDATQEGFARALERWERLRDKEWVGGWVMRTAMNSVRRSRRLRSRVASGPAAEAAVQLGAKIVLVHVVGSIVSRARAARALNRCAFTAPSEHPIAEATCSTGWSRA